MATEAARHGHLELVQWLCGEEEGGFAMDETVMAEAAQSGNLGLVRWLRAEGCGWKKDACAQAGRRQRVSRGRWR